MAVCALAAACGGDSPSEPCIGPFRAGGDVKPPILLFRPLPQYTEAARRARIEGVVILELHIDCVGSVTNVEILKGLPMGLSEAAVEVAYRYRWEPATQNGRTVSVFYNVTVNFGLQ